MKKQYFKPILEVAEYNINKDVTLDLVSLFFPSGEEEEGESYDDVVWE